jgi:hypothetical protein
MAAHTSARAAARVRADDGELVRELAAALRALERYLVVAHRVLDDADAQASVDEAVRILSVVDGLLARMAGELRAPGAATDLRELSQDLAAGVARSVCNASSSWALGGLARAVRMAGSRLLAITALMPTGELLEAAAIDPA